MSSIGLPRIQILHRCSYSESRSLACWESDGCFHRIHCHSWRGNTCSPFRHNSTESRIVYLHTNTVHCQVAQSKFQRHLSNCFIIKFAIIEKKKSWKKVKRISKMYLHIAPIERPIIEKLAAASLLQEMNLIFAVRFVPYTLWL